MRNIPADGKPGASKIAIYTIAKNEEKFVERWYEAGKGADQLIILDTGSTDNTVQKARALGITVHEIKLEKWRFDTARNAALAMVPTDVRWCFSVDMDECVSAGWREKLEEAVAAHPDATMLSCLYWWNAHRPKAPRREWMFQKIHRRHACHWKNAVHEVLCGNGPCVTHEAMGVRVEHHPDDLKSRGQYLGLLELDVRDDPENDRNAHYLGREYMYGGRWDDAIAELTRHLALKTATWKCERAASMRYMAACFKSRGDTPAARGWYYSAAQESPDERDSWMDLAQFEYQQQNWAGCVAALKSRFRITDRNMHYISTGLPWGELPYDIGSVAAWYAGEKGLAAEWMGKLLEMAKNPKDERLQKNAELVLG